jgi:hypothetical protein
MGASAILLLIGFAHVNFNFTGDSFILPISTNSNIQQVAGVISSAYIRS